VGKKMVERKKGNIINMSTQFAFKAPTIGMGAYAIAKAGVVMLTRVLAQELGRYGIRSNAIAPGLTRTDFSRATWSNPELTRQIEASLPLGRMAETSDLVGAALFLASDASTYLTGHTILMEGGGLAWNAGAITHEQRIQHESKMGRNLVHSRGRGVVSLLLEKSLQRLFGLLRSIQPPAFSLGPSQGKIVAVIGSFLVYDPLSWNFTTFIVGIGIIGLALFATAKVTVTMRATVLSFDRSDNIENAATKNAAHHIFVLDQLTPPP
jgi:hypothetical protein